jgi:hypothetical protein
VSKAAAFRQVDVTRAIRGAEAAGQVVSSVKIEGDGTIVVVLGSGVTFERRNPLDRLLEQ